MAAIAAAAMATGVSVFAEEDDSLARIQEAGELKIGTEGTYAPFTYYDENDNLVGYDVEIAEAGFAELVQLVCEQYTRKKLPLSRIVLREATALLFGFCLNIQQLTVCFQCPICLMGKYTFCQYFSKLYAFLIKAVQIPYKSLEHDFILEV